MHDVTYRDEGTVTVFSFHSEEAQNFLREQVFYDTWQQIGPHAIATDWRAGLELLSVLRDEGFLAKEE